MVKRIILSVLLFLVAGAGFFTFKLVWGKPFSFNHAVERIMLESLFKDPETLTYLGMLENTLLDFHSDRLTIASPDFDRELLDLAKKQKALVPVSYTHLTLPTN